MRHIRDGMVHQFGGDVAPELVHGGVPSAVEAAVVGIVADGAGREVPQAVAPQEAPEGALAGPPAEHTDEQPRPEHGPRQDRRPPTGAERGGLGVGDQLPKASFDGIEAGRGNHDGTPSTEKRHAPPQPTPTTILSAQMAPGYRPLYVTRSVVSVSVPPLGL